MDDQQRVKLGAEQADLQRRLNARRDMSGYADNAKAIQARLDLIVQQLADG